MQNYLIMNYTPPHTHTQKTVSKSKLYCYVGIFYTVPAWKKLLKAMVYGGMEMEGKDVYGGWRFWMVWIGK